MNGSLKGRYRLALITTLLACFLCVAGSDSCAQQITTFILVRHAEKAIDQGKDPLLSEDGKLRAMRLQSLFEKASIDAIYSTPTRRTHATVEPLAQAKGITVREYVSQKETEIDKMLRQHAGGTILITGHSNTIPQIANWLTGTKQYSDFDEGDYGNVLIVSVVEKGKVANLIWMRY